MRKDTTLKLDTTEEADIQDFGPRCKGITDVGSVREENEDNFSIVRQRGCCLLGVFDGMGGMKKGEVSSRIAKETLITSAKESKICERSLIKTVFERANREIFKYSVENGIKGKTGTTGVIAIIKNGMLYYGNVGDSRLYILRNGKLQKLTNDHSLIAMQVKKGIISEREAKKSSLKNILTRAIGVKETVMPELYAPMRLEKGDLILLCTDGLYNMVSEKVIAKILSKSRLSFSLKLKKLVDTANKNGGLDNITAVVCQCGEKKEKKVKTGFYFAIIAILALALIWVFEKPLILKLLKALKAGW